MVLWVGFLWFVFFPETITLFAVNIANLRTSDLFLITIGKLYLLPDKGILPFLACGQ